MRNFQDTLETRKRSFISAFLICLTVPLKPMSFFVTILKKFDTNICFTLDLLQHRVAHFLDLQKQPSVVFYKKGVLKNFARFTGKHLSLFRQNTSTVLFTHTRSHVPWFH